MRLQVSLDLSLLLAPTATGACRFARIWKCSRAEIADSQKGKIAFTNAEISYKFASAANLETFKKNPTKYEPAYGGWCAYAMGAKGEKVEVDPENYKIVNGTLNLFYKSFFSNTLDDWNKNETKLRKQADVNWLKLYK